ncbi:ester cyclase [Mucilaginibacter ginsenosidivorans]|uniref:Ester cyclase n=1 Tax=Mucilaginibacter ginsenosidivorans TaxID=398053 RepID=A0A5B8UZ15_9SPHI|nr:ester cyclase [Mucilaginibacter ginsenosidivorans]QEC63823.1 ester cyclase [Mucilaginibacter ginsenosidivorans]
MTEQEKQNKAIVIRFNKEVLEKGNIDVINEVIHPDFINHTAPASARGPQGIIDFTINILQKSLSGIRVEIHDQVLEDEKVVTRKTISGTHIAAFMGIPASGREVTISIIDIIILKDGQYTDHWSIRDLQDVIEKSLGRL